MERQDADYEENYEEPYEEEEESGELPEEDIIEESSGDETSDEGGTEEEESRAISREKSSGRPSAHRRIQDITRQKHQTQAELQRVKEEYESLKRYAAELTEKSKNSEYAAAYHYEKSADMKVLQAKARKQKLLDEGALPEELVEADYELASAVAEQREIKNFKAEQEAAQQRQKAYDEQQQQYQAQQQQISSANQQQIQAAQAESFGNWVEENDWFHPQSKNHDAELSNAVKAYSNEVENYLFRTGQQHLILSDDYYEAIDAYVNKFREDREKNMSSGRPLRMKPASGAIAPARSMSSGHSQSEQKNALTREEREMARAMGVKENVYYQHKLRDIKINAHKRSR